ncbi:MMPL family transporter [Winslowiella iniecta]|uniref:Membrane protein n=1 Tax=Winslowiella iniecta TaxID=1560201 RepID=A0A0L7TEE1_9GAMM|nr:MMPL family transporter [Winslowiella iniecta]KOC90516.1 membrane protein [Winslowiella iniecta]KOC93606.1 membrane protein [Winslowiella iniecta]
MKNNALFSERLRIAAAGWLAVCLLLLATLALLLPRATINSSVLALLPKQAMGAIPDDLQQGFMQRLDRQMVWLISPGEQGDTAVADDFLHALQAMPALKNVKGPVDAQQQQQWGQFAWQQRNGLIDPATRQRLADGGGAQADWILAQLYSAFAGVSGKELANDPLLLVRGAQLAMQQNASQLTLRDGWLMAHDKQGRQWYFIHGELASNSFDMQQSHAVVQQLHSLASRLQQQYPDTRLLTRGTVLYSDFASQQARHDVATLGVATVIGVLLLVFSVFRSPRPLLLCALSVSIGALAGTTITLLCFGELHLMTLVMSISIVGISADYTLYYLTERMVHGADVSAQQSLQKVMPALLLALATAAIAYLMMLFAPFPGLRQLAVFAASGLTASCLTVVCWYPWLVRGLPVRPVPAMLLMARWLAAWRRQRWLKFGLPLLVALISVSGLAMLKVDDDISQLQALPPQLLQQDAQLTQLTGQSADQTWFMVWGNSAEQTLQRLEALAPQLQHAQQQRSLTSWRLLPLASQAQQQRDVALLKQAAPTVMAQLRQAGVEIAEPDLRAMTVTPEAWQRSPNSEGWRLLWLSLPNGRSGALVPVSGVQNSAQLAELAQALPGVAWIDRKSTFDQLFSFYRVMLGWLLLAALAFIALSYMLRLGIRRGLVSVLPSVLSLGGGLAALAFSGHSLNLFSLLALVLVLGIGINYTLFFSNPRGTPITSLLAVSLAMSTTLLTLGMLVFSQTQAISSFGIVLCSGIFTAFLLAPLALPESRRKKR